MTSIIPATERDYLSIASIGRVTVEEAHRDSCLVEDMNAFLDSTYSEEAVKEELNDPKNVYHVITANDKIVGFSKIILNTEHTNIPQKNVTKLDRIYLLKEFHGMKLGLQLLQFNIDLCRKNDQSGMWLFTWVGNTKAVNFYLESGFTIVGSHQFMVTQTHYNQHHQMFRSLD